MRSPQAPARPRGPIRRRRYDPEALIASTRWSPEQQAKIAKVMREFKSGDLKSSSGSRVTSKRQALAIALSEAKQLTAAAFVEEEHPRDDGGKFTFKAQRTRVSDDEGGSWRDETPEEFTADLEKHVAALGGRVKGAEEEMYRRRNDMLASKMEARESHARAVEVHKQAQAVLEKVKKEGAPPVHKDITASGRFDRPVLATGWDESKHPRHPGGTSEGGRFSRKGVVLAKIAGHADDQTRGVYQRGVVPSEEPEVAQLVESGDVVEGTHGKLRPTAQGYDTLRRMQESGEAPGQAPRTGMGLGSEESGETAPDNEQAETQSMYSDTRMPPKAEGEASVKVSANGKVMRWNPDQSAWEQVTTVETVDEQAGHAADQLIQMTDDIGTEIYNGDMGMEEYDAYAQAITQLEENADWSGVIEEAMAQSGLPMEDDTDWENSYGIMEQRVVERMRKAAPVFDRFFGGETASAMTASAAGLAPLVPPKSWFEKPALEGPTGMTVTADGQVYGHAALWGTCHTGMPGVCRTPPRSESGYRYFHLGEVDTDDGPVHVGRVSMDTGHAPLTASRDGAVRHYDHTGTQIAHVRAYEDEHGIVLAGALVPDAPAEKARRFKGATVSGDWRSIGGKLELVGMLAVNVPGFPVPRAMAASLVVEDEPHTMALVAAGIYSDPEDEGRKLKALTARALGGLDGLAAAAGYEPASRRRMGVTAAGRSFDPSKHPRVAKGQPGGGRFTNLAGLSQEEAAAALDSISFDDKVTIMVPAGIGKEGPEYKAKTGRARIKSEHGWALNMGGAHGTPGVATERNIAKVKPS